MNTPRRRGPARVDPLVCPSCHHVLSPYALEDEAARYIRRSPKTLRSLCVRGNGPRFQQAEPGGSVTYAFSDLDAWMRSITRYSTSDSSFGDKTDPQ